MTESLCRAPWIVCQIGAREHYALARALHQRGRLAQLITDVWVPPGSLLRLLPGTAGVRLKSRFDDALAQADVAHFTHEFLGRDVWQKFERQAGKWGVIVSRNERFQSVASAYLRSNDFLKGRGAPKPVVFAYSYAAREIFIEAKRRGAQTVLGQIDGGISDARYIESIRLKEAHKWPKVEPPPAAYWDNWFEECRLADKIVVNSIWSRELLLQAKIGPEKIAVVPVIYEQKNALSDRPKDYPATFSQSRPMRVLLLGSLLARKGVLEALAAADELSGEPVEFWFVGSDPEGHGDHARRCKNIKWIPAVPRPEASKYYKYADAFLFPTHSDGFGMTQVEAQNYGLPVIASKQCGQVVEDGVSGIVLPEVSKDAIATVLRGLQSRPELLREMSAASRLKLSRYSGKVVLDQLFSSIASR